MLSMHERATYSVDCLSAFASPRLSSSAKADDPVIAGPREGHRFGLDHPRTGYWMPACAGMTTEL
jgi:hypothetical protein